MLLQKLSKKYSTVNIFFLSIVRFKITKQTLTTLINKMLNLDEI